VWCPGKLFIIIIASDPQGALFGLVGPRKDAPFVSRKANRSPRHGMATGKALIAPKLRA
jgi:hypothetical protein